jgi:hypothetical protein
MHYDSAVLEGAAKRVRQDMWRTVASDAIEECGIEERCFGPVLATAFEVMPEFPSLNEILGAAEPDAVAGGHLAAAVAWLDSLAVDYRVPVARRRPGTAEAEDWLNLHGFEQGSGRVKYVRDGSLPDLPPHPHITVWEIGEDEADGETLVEAAPMLGMPSPASSLLFGLPSQRNWRTYTVELEGEIVSFGSMLIHDGVALLGFDATFAEARRRGCHQALLRRRLLDAFDAGCETVAMEMPESDDEEIATATRNLYRAGFVPAYRSMNWQRSRNWGFRTADPFFV